MLSRSISCAVGVVLGALAASAWAYDPPVKTAAASVAPEQGACQGCISHHCVLVPEVKQIKKTVYEVHEVYKRVLVKKEIVCDEICTTKCVPQPCLSK
jgi:hypothetical protein